AIGSVREARIRRSGRSPSGTPVALRDDRWPRASRDIRRSARLPDGSPWSRCGGRKIFMRVQVADAEPPNTRREQIAQSMASQPPRDWAGHDRAVMFNGPPGGIIVLSFPAAALRRVVVHGMIAALASRVAGAAR